MIKLIKRRIRFMTIDTSALAAFLQPAHTGIIVVLYLLGMWIKKSKLIRDHLIPFILAACSIVLCTLYAFSSSSLPATFQATSGMIFNIIVQALFCVAGAVYFNQIYKQILKKTKPPEITNSDGSDE